MFVDIDRDTYNLDPRRVEEAITPRTRAILAVHQVGQPAAMNEILEVARKHSLPVVEDAACADWFGVPRSPHRCAARRDGHFQFPSAQDLDDG